MSKFNQVFFEGELLDGFQVIDTNWDPNGICKRCGEAFIKKYKEQIFCSRKCVSKYRNKVNTMMEKPGFKEWWDELHSPIDTKNIIGYDEWEKRI